MSAGEDIEFRWRNGRGEWCDSVGRVFRPTRVGRRVPLIYYAGYEADPSLVQGWTAAGFVVVTTVTPEEGSVWPHDNPIPRGPEMDLALLRAARALPDVDDSRVIVTGASAGGYMTMMVAAATFPLSGAFPLVPPVNLPYNLACWFHDTDTITVLRSDGVTTVMAHPGSADIQALGRGVLEQHGDLTSSRLFAYSPLAHLDRITCPVVIWFSTADALVPHPQVGGPLTQATIEGAPSIYPIDPAVVATGALAERCRRTLVGELPADDVQVEVLPVPADAPPYSDEPTELAVVLPAPPRRARWEVIIVDEGPTDPDIGHFRHLVGVDTIAQLMECMNTALYVEQLNAVKLRQLVDRFDGRGWILSGDDAHAGDPDVLDAERLDVLRGLRTYCNVSPAHAGRYEEMRSAYSWARDVLPESDDLLAVAVDA